MPASGKRISRVCIASTWRANRRIACWISTTCCCTGTSMMQTPALAQSLSKNFDHVLVDEYQDTSTLQGDIVHALKPDGKGVTVVGDDCTGDLLVSRRGGREHPGIRRSLQAQGRDGGAVAELPLDAADAGHRQRADGRRRAPASQDPARHAPIDRRSRSTWRWTMRRRRPNTSAGKILQTREIGGSLKRHAILFRSSHHSDVLEVELAKKNIPFVKYGGLKFLEAAHVKDMMSVLRWADNPRNSVAGFRVLKLLPGIGPATAKQALDHFEAQGFEVKSLAGFDAPQPVKMDWKRFCALFEKLADPATPWPGQVGLVREWYKPQLERIYDAGWTRMGDLEQLEHMSVAASQPRAILDGA